MLLRYICKLNNILFWLLIFVAMKVGQLAWIQRISAVWFWLFGLGWAWGHFRGVANFPVISSSRFPPPAALVGTFSFLPPHICPPNTFRLVLQRLSILVLGSWLGGLIRYLMYETNELFIIGPISITDLPSQSWPILSCNFSDFSDWNSEVQAWNIYQGTTPIFPWDQPHPW